MMGMDFILVHGSYTHNCTHSPTCSSSPTPCATLAVFAPQLGTVFSVLTSSIENGCVVNYQVSVFLMMVFRSKITTSSRLT